MRGADAEDVRRQVSILSLLPAGQAVRKTASNRWVTLCSFHKDSRASMSVSRAEFGWVFNCFACGERGDVISFAMKRDRLSFKDAIDQLSKGGIMAMAAPPERKSKWLLVCDGKGCGATKAVEAGDICFWGSWSRSAGGKTWCHRCAPDTRAGTVQLSDWARRLGHIFRRRIEWLIGVRQDNRRAA